MAGAKEKTEKKMTNDYIAIARSRRLTALNETTIPTGSERRARKVHMFPVLTPRHIDDLFLSSRGVRGSNGLRLVA